MCILSVFKYSNEIPPILHDRPRRLDKQAIRELANTFSSSSDLTRNCLDYQYQGPQRKHLHGQAITAGTMTAKAYNMLGFQGHNLTKCNLQKKQLKSYFIDKEFAKK